MSRSAILFLALFCINVLLGLIVLTVARGERKSRALQLWGWGLLTYGAGQLFFVIPNLIQRDVQLVLGNAFIILSGMLTALGVYEHTPVRVNRPLVFGGFVGTVLTLAICHLLNMSVIMDALVPTIYATLLYSGAAALLLTRPPTAARAAARFLAVTLIANIVMWIVRVGALWLSLDGAEVNESTEIPDRTDITMSLFVIAQILALVAGTLSMLWIEVRLMEQALREAASTDLLTGILNRRATRERFDQEIARCERLHEQFGMALFDIDHFKTINDRYGHHIGDRILRRVAQTMKKSTRHEDVLGRIGGEEFVVILPHHDRAATLQAAQRLRRAVWEATSKHKKSKTTGVTISGGVSLYPEDGMTWDELYMAADRRMYRAKDSGRNRIEDVSS